MNKTIVRKSLVVTLAAVLIIVTTSLAVQPAAANGTIVVPIENNFISCQQVSIDRVWVDDGVRHIRGRLLHGEVRSNEDFHPGFATNLIDVNWDLTTGLATFHGEVTMYPDAYPNGGWEGIFNAQGLMGQQTGKSVLKGTGSLKGYLTMLEFTHLSGPEIHALYPDACGGNMPLGASQAVGYVLIPAGKE